MNADFAVKYGFKPRFPGYQKIKSGIFYKNRRKIFQYGKLLSEIMENLSYSKKEIE